MMKSLLVFFALLIGLSVSAQQTGKNTAVKKINTFTNRIDVDNSSNSVAPTVTPRATVKGTSAVQKVFMGSSRNAFTLLVAEQTCMYYNKEVDAIMGTFRGNDKSNAGTLGTLGNGNDVCTYWSTDGGDSFTGKISLVGTTTLRNRYPSGVIYNPAGNTDINNAFSLVAGPVTNGAGWTNTFLSSVQYDGQNLDKKYLPVSALGELVREGLTVLPNGDAFICTVKSANDGTNYTTIQPHVKKGVFNSNTYAWDWTEQDVPSNFWVNGGLPEGTTTANMAFSPDGSVGYMLNIGVDARATEVKGYYPVLHKTTDHGATWELVDYFDFSKLPGVFENIWSTTANPDVAVPFFTEADITVDAAGNPHIMALCQGHFSQHPDSLGYTFLYEVTSAFEFSYEHGQWFSHFIGHLKTRDVPGADSPFTTTPPPNVGWDMRLQASRTTDGNKVFAVWTDTDWQFWSLEDSTNLYPDVMMWGRDITTNLNTPVKNVTYLEDGMGECHFMFVSPITKDAAGIYTVPLSISDINTSGLSADEPINHFSLKGAEFTEADFSILGGQKTERAALTVTNYPNPFSGKTNIDINIKKANPVSIVVNSITGQQVSSVNYGTMSAGAQTLVFDASNLTPGVYFYTVTVGDLKATNKMIIK